MDHVVVDVEIQRCIEDLPRGWDQTEDMGVAVACVWEYSTQRMRVYGPEDVGALRERLLQADRISGFNIFNFDFPVIWGIDKKTWSDYRVIPPESRPHYTKESMVSNITGENIKAILSTKTDDMLRRIWQAKGLDPDRFSPSTHGGVGLDAVASATIGAAKIGYGGDAPVWYQKGLIQKVANYCADDVAIERDLTDFVERYGYVIAKGQKLTIPPWGSRPITSVLFFQGEL